MTEDFRISRCINWNKLDDPLDGQVWDTLVGNFWLPESVPVSQDLPTWRLMSDEEKDVTGKVFTALGCLDHLQGTIGAPSLIPIALTEHEAAVMTNISFMESVHSRSYSTIFQTLFHTPLIDHYFEWAESDPVLQKKLAIYRGYYEGSDPHKRRIAVVMLESFSFYSQFFWAFYNSARGKLTQTANIISLIVRDEQVHGAYVGSKYQKATADLIQSEKDDLLIFTLDFLNELYEVEKAFIESIYDQVGLSEVVKNFLRYNGNRALANLGYDPLFPADQIETPAEIISALSGKQINHDFFSLKGSSYKVLPTSEVKEEDWNF